MISRNIFHHRHLLISKFLLMMIMELLLTFFLTMVTSRIEENRRDDNNNNSCVPRQGNCDFYHSCIENNILSCGKDGYSLGYGLKYCEKFQQISFQSQAGNLWRNQTTFCLQQSFLMEAKDVEDFSIGNETLWRTRRFSSCAALKDFAFAAHAPCYCKEPYSICHIYNLYDLWAILQTIDIGDLIMSREGHQQTLSVIANCWIGGGNVFYYSLGLLIIIIVLLLLL